MPGQTRLSDRKSTPEGTPSLEQQEFQLIEVRARHMRCIARLAPLALGVAARQSSKLIVGHTVEGVLDHFAESKPIVTRIPEFETEPGIVLGMGFVPMVRGGRFGSFQNVRIGWVDSLEPETLLDTDYQLQPEFGFDALDVVYPLARELQILRLGTETIPPELPNLSLNFQVIRETPEPPEGWHRPSTSPT